MTISCFECGVTAQACTFLLDDKAGQSLCLQSQGWRHSRAKARNWYCLSCRIRHFPEDRSLPDPANLPVFCAGHLPHAQEVLNSIGYVDGMWGGTSSSSQAPPPPPPPPPPPGAGSFAVQCRDPFCQSSWRSCAFCLRFQGQYGAPLTAIADAPEYRVALMVSSLCDSLNTTPTECLPSWVINPTTTIAREAQHVAELRWDDCGNLAGSVMMLIMLRPLVFGMPWVAPLRIFGVPPPASLLDLDGPTSTRRPHDNHRTNCVEGLLGYFRSVADRSRGDQLQDCWYLVRAVIGQQNWHALPSWYITRRSLNVPFSNALLPGIV